MAVLENIEEFALLKGQLLGGLRLVCRASTDDLLRGHDGGGWFGHCGEGGRDLKLRRLLVAIERLSEGLHGCLARTGSWPDKEMDGGESEGKIKERSLLL